MIFTASIRNADNLEATAHWPLVHQSYDGFDTTQNVVMEITETWDGGVEKVYKAAERPGLWQQEAFSISLVLHQQELSKSEPSP